MLKQQFLDYQQLINSFTDSEHLFQLLEDFKTEYSDKENKLYANWPRVANAVIKVIRSQKSNILKTALADYEKTSSRKIDISNLRGIIQTFFLLRCDLFFCVLGCDQLFIFTLLPLLFTSPAPIKTKKKKWIPSKFEVKEGFILQVKVIPL